MYNIMHSIQKKIGLSNKYETILILKSLKYFKLYARAKVKKFENLEFLSSFKKGSKDSKFKKL